MNELESIAETNLADSIERIARRPTIVNHPGIEAPQALLPEGWSIRDLEDHLPTPVRKRGTVVLQDLSSFIGYCIRHRDEARSLIYCDADFLKGAATFVAVLDDHRADGAEWRGHRAIYRPPHSVEWTRWMKADRQPMQQVAFATFIEDNLQDIATVADMPSAAQMMEMALGMEATQDMRIKSHVRLQSGGVDLTYVNQENEATLQKMKIFDRFAIGIPVVFNGRRYRIDARLRYRFKDGITFWYELIRPDLVFADAVQGDEDGMISTIRTQVSLNVLMGTPSN